MLLLPCGSAGSGGATHKACTVASSCYYFWAVSHKAADSHSTSVAALSATLSVFLKAVSKHIVCQANISSDPFQSVCINLSLNSCKSLLISFLGPNQS